ncbi:glycosyltransferase [Saliphagus infecundisoli]|uniref:Glycosyltransferase n=1 Tax=Saliphagus infecundisoli TaxID=1849069 RepID=A0ABD5QFW9_9EURY|nr:glycosyltransferase [Saliphagus infecundisoli]
MSHTETVGAFTDLYLPTVNGVTSTVGLWREHWSARRGPMSVVYPRVEGYEPAEDEHPVRSVRAPFFPRYRLGLPLVPDGLAAPDLVHVHTPFTVGYAGLRFARERGLPVVASYHTLLGERADRIAPRPFSDGLRSVCRGYERAFFERADRVIVPTAFARRHLLETVGADVDARVVSNGIDTDLFRPVDPSRLRSRYDLPDSPLVGYTGRHGPEKNLGEAIDAVSGTGVSLAIAGDGPARGEWEARAREADADVRFLGFLDRAELPAFYSALDAFVFPSPVETQGLVALEATACGTPVVAVDAGALTEFVIGGETGYRYRRGDVEDFRYAIRRALAERDRLSDLCVRRRSMLSVEHSVGQLAGIYDELV